MLLCGIECPEVQDLHDAIVKPGDHQGGHEPDLEVCHARIDRSEPQPQKGRSHVYGNREQ